MKKIFSRRGAAMITVLVVMVMVMMFSVLLLNLATLSWSRSNRENGLSQDRMTADMVGYAFLAQGLSLDVSVYPDQYEYLIDDESRKLTVNRASDGQLMLEVIIDVNGDLVSWRSYYR